MNFLKKLAFRLVRDDIDTVLKAHDKTIMDHYYKIIDDVEDILEEKLKSLDNKFEELKTDIYGEVESDAAPAQEEKCGCPYCKTSGEIDA